MKTSIKVLISLIMIVPAISLKAQNTNPTTTGIYMTANDYKANKLSYVLGTHDKLQLNEFLNGENISLVYQGKKIKIAKSEIYGYRLNNKDFRFFQNEAYRILDTAGFAMYSRQQLVQQGKGSKPVVQHYYSVDATQPVLTLTMQNLWNSFPGQAGFRYSIQNKFKNDTDLATYDKLDSQYEIKYLYFQQKQVIASHQSL